MASIRAGVVGVGHLGYHHARNYAALHMHVPHGWTLGHAARLRTEVEARLMQAVPGLRATIELLPQNHATVFETMHEEEDGQP